MRTKTLGYDDGTGVITIARITNNGHVYSSAAIQSTCKTRSLDGYSFVVDNNETATTLSMTATGGYLLLLKATSDDYNIVVSRINISSDTANVYVGIYKNVTIGIINKANEQTPINMNFGSSQAAGAVGYVWDETGDGIGGLTGGTLLSTMILNAGSEKIDLQDAIVLENGDNIAIKMWNVIAEVTINVLFNEVTTA